MAATYGAAVSEEAPAIVDTASSQSTGAVSQGIGLTGLTGDSIDGWRIGASATTTDIEYYYPT